MFLSNPNLIHFFAISTYHFFHLGDCRCLIPAITCVPVSVNFLVPVPVPVADADYRHRQEHIGACPEVQLKNLIK